MKKYFFEISVYRLSEKDYQKEENKFSLEFYNDVFLRNGKVKSPTSYENFKEKSMMHRDTWRV